jgi:FtsH-binding integral membrane protein
MTNKIYQLFEYAYIVMFIFAIYMVVTNWEANRDQAYLFAFFGVVAIFMFFFKRRFRKKLEERKQDQ